MKRKIRLLALALATSMCFAVFTGCQQNQASSAPASQQESQKPAGASSGGAEPEPAAESQTLRIGAQSWMMEKFQLQEAADKFMEDHPGVTVEFVQVELADTTSYVLQWSQGKTNVDLAIGGSREQAVQYVAKDLIYSFEEGFFDDSLKKEDFIPSVFELGNIDGTQYMIPLMGEVYYLVVRSDLMKEAGLTDADGKVIPPKSWEELYDYAVKLTKKDGDTVTQSGLGIDWGNDFMHYTYMGVLQSLRGSIFEDNSNLLDFQSEEAEYMLTQWAKLVADGVVATDTFADTNAVRTNFKAGNVAMHLTVHSRWPEYADVLGYDKVTLVPLPGAEENGSLTFIHGMVIPKASQCPELAKSFIKERLMDKDFQLWTLNKYGKMPVLFRNFEGAEHEEWNDIADMAAKSAAAPLYKDWAKLQNKMQIELQNAILSKQTPRQTLDNLHEELLSLDTTTGLS